MDNNGFITIVLLSIASIWMCLGFWMAVFVAIIMCFGALAAECCGVKQL